MVQKSNQIKTLPFKKKKIAQTMQPPSRHASFFSSLKQVEKRLKLEHQLKPSNSSSSRPVPETSTESLSSPIYLHLDQTNNNSTLQESSGSEPPQAFLSLSPEFPPTQQNPPHKPAHVEETDDIDDIQRLMQLLGLQDLVEEEKGRVCDVGCSECECQCEGGFYEKIVGVKGPKCEKEVKRMEGWIDYFLRDCDGEEPLRLAYLLLGKAACDLDGADSGFGGLEFPSTLDDFLRHDPPKL